MTKRLHTGLVMAVLVLAGCRGTVSDKPPIHINPNMDFQEKFEPQEANPMFADGRAMRPPVAGTVARGFLREDTRFYEGREADGSYVDTLPVALTTDLLHRGRDRYNIYCAPCHGEAGDGRGIVVERGFVPPPNFGAQTVRDMQDGYLYEVIKNGVRTMPSYAQQVAAADRWAIVSYIRALQFSQNATQGHIPASELANIARRGN